MNKLLITIALLCFSVLLNAAEIMIYPGPMKGNDYLESGDAQKYGYVQGWYEGIFISPIFEADFEQVGELRDCLSGMTTAQLVAILDLYLSENPVEWNQSLNILLYRALVIEACEL